MAELKCPHCGQAFTVDDAELSSIVSQIRDKEFNNDVKRKYSESQDFLGSRAFLGNSVRYQK